MDWKPIETAPKDGRRVLLYWPHWAHYPIVGLYGVYGWASEVALAKEPGPTHWMPLPKPPRD